MFVCLQIIQIIREFIQDGSSSKLQRLIWDWDVLKKQAEKLKSRLLIEIKKNYEVEESFP